MTAYSKLDHADVLAHIFFPRQEERTPLPAGSRDFDCTVEENTDLGCRFYGASEDGPVIVYFHGNAETVGDYDAIAAGYARQGINLLLTTYRGFGWSTGSPSVSAMFQDAEVVFQKSLLWLEENGYTGNLFVMGRSLGSAPAIDLTARHQDTIKGMIIESGFSDTLPLAETLGINTEGSDITEEECFNNCAKIATITLPTLILHGSADAMIPLGMAEKLQSCSGARSKKFLVIPGAEHNTMITTGGELYFQTIRQFIDDTCGSNDWRSRRRRYREKNKK